MLAPVEPNLTGRAVLWYDEIGGNLVVYCFTPPHET